MSLDSILINRGFDSRQQAPGGKPHLVPFAKILSPVALPPPSPKGLMTLLMPMFVVMLVVLNPPLDGLQFPDSHSVSYSVMI